MDLVDISVLVSCYNEESSVVPTIASISNALSRSGMSWEIIVIDDASADESATSIRGFISEHPALPIRLIVHETNRGLVAGIFETLTIAQGQYYWVVAGDNNVDPETALTLLSHVGKVDIVIPKVLNYSGRGVPRRLISKAYAFLVRLLSGCPVAYYNGSSIHRRSHLIWLSDKIGSFAYAADCITRLLELGYTYVEVPVIYKERAEGKSSALTIKNFRDVSKFLSGLALRRVKRLFQSSKPISQNEGVPLQ